MRKYIVRVGYRDFYFDDINEATLFAKMGVTHIEEGEEILLRRKEEEPSNEADATATEEGSSERTIIV